MASAYNYKHTHVMLVLMQHGNITRPGLHAKAFLVTQTGRRRAASKSSNTPSLTSINSLPRAIATNVLQSWGKYKHEHYKQYKHAPLMSCKQTN